MRLPEDAIGDTSICEGVASLAMSLKASEISEFAKALRAARLARETSVVDAASCLLLSDKQIIGLESDDHSYFYSSLYAERAARAYAALLDVDISLDGGPPYIPSRQQTLKTILQSPRELQSRSALSRRTRISIGILVILALVISFFFAESGNKFPPTAVPTTDSEPSVEIDDIVSSDSKTSASNVETISEEAAAIEWIPDAQELRVSVGRVTTQTDTVGSVTAIDNVPGDDKEKRFFIVIRAETSIIAKDATGKILITGRQTPSVGRRVSGKPPFSVELGDPDAVEIYYLGERIRPGRTDVDGIRVSSK